jgi:fluoroquinolone transport system permease protein
MAMVKLSGIVLLGLPVPFFLMSDVQYLFSPLPSFWIAKLTVEQNYLFFLPALISSVLWFWLFYRKFDHKLK